jgi:hypothetical protein
MQRLYCPECGEYLEGGDGSMCDCICGWRQPVERNDNYLRDEPEWQSDVQAAFGGIVQTPQG